MPHDTTSLGPRTRVATLTRRLEDATTGNRDGIVRNEGQKAGATAGTSSFDTNPLLFKLRAFFEVGVSKADEEKRLARFLRGAENTWGRSVSDLAKPGHVSSKDWASFLVDKAITLVRLGRDPSEVEDAVVRAAGSVDEQAIAPRDLFVQRWKPIGEPSGKTIVIAPGFLETGRNYVEQIQLLNKEGHEVVVMDQQWAGLSSGKRGGIDRGYGIARDVAAVAAHAGRGGGEVVLVGTSMGGGAGVTGAWLLNQLGLIALEGDPMPKVLRAVAQDPFFDRSAGALNSTLSALGQVPGFSQVPMPSLGAPILSHDQAALRKIAAHGTVERITGRAQAFNASNYDLVNMKDIVRTGVALEGRLEILHAKQDPLASPAAAVRWANLLGDHAHIELYDSNNHVPEENAKEQGLLLGALSRLGV